MYDVVIIGAGPGGAATSYFLAKRGFNVLLLDKASFPRDKTCGDGLTPRALAVLRDMHLLDELKQVGQYVNHLAVFAPKGHSIGANFPTRQDSINYSLIVPRFQLDDIIRQRAISAGAQYHSPVNITSITGDTNGVSVIGTAQGQVVSYRAQVAVVATGASIGLLKSLGLIKKTLPILLAARSYYERLRDMSPDCIQLRFQSVPQPGYGWVFPISDTAANIGVFCHPRSRAVTARTAFDQFLQLAAIQAQLQDAQHIAPIKGYPVNTNFGTYRTFDQRLLLVGEAAGLVNPLTGDGTDFALATGKLAAAFLAKQFPANDFSRKAMSRYHLLLLQRYERLFELCRSALGWLENPLIFNQLIRGGKLLPIFNKLIVDRLLGD